MRRTTAERLAELYPQTWRDRFGDEFVDLLEGEDLGPHILIDIVVSATSERLMGISTLEARMAYASNVIALTRRPSGFIPILCSLAAATLAILAVTLTNAARTTDESAAAHVFQLLIVAQAPMLAVFAIRWIRGATWAGLTVMALQVCAIAAALFPVWFFNL